MTEININYRQWATQKKKSIAYETIELYHERVGTLRYVTRQQFSKIFTLGNDAPRNPNQQVYFTPLGFLAQRPAQNNEPILRLDINLGRVGSDLKNKLKNISTANDFMSKAELIFRIFLNDEQVQSMAFEINSIIINDSDVLIRAEQENPTFRNISRRYLSDDFPGLEVSI